MFEYSFVPTGRTRRPQMVVVAAIGEAILVTGLVLVPMWFVQELPARGLLKTLMLALVPFAPPALPPMLAKAIPHAAPAQRQLTMPMHFLVSLGSGAESSLSCRGAPAIELEAMAGGVAGGIPGPALPGTGTGFFSSALGCSAASTATAQDCRRGPPVVPSQITVGGDAGGPAPATVQPVYPTLARQGRIQGNVHTKGHRQRRRQDKEFDRGQRPPVVSGRCPDAVRHWTYQPTLLNGILVEVKTEILVRFELGRKAT